MRIEVIPDDSDDKFGRERAETSWRRRAHLGVGSEWFGRMWVGRRGGGHHCSTTRCKSNQIKSKDWKSKLTRGIGNRPKIPILISLRSPPAAGRRMAHIILHSTDSGKTETFTASSTRKFSKFALFGAVSSLFCSYVSLLLRLI